MKITLLLSAFLIFGESYSQAQTIGTNLIVETFAGSAFQGTVDGQGAKTMFDKPGPLEFSIDGVLHCFQRLAARPIDQDANVSSLVYGYNPSGGYGPGFDRVTFGAGDELIGQHIINSERWIAYKAKTDQSLFSSPGPILYHSGLATYLSFSDTQILKGPVGNEKKFEVFVGSGNSGQLDGSGLFCSFLKISQMDIAPNGSIVVADDSAIRRIDLDGTVTTIKRLAAKPPATSILASPDGSILVAYESKIISINGTNATVLTGGLSWTNIATPLIQNGGPSTICLSEKQNPSVVRLLKIQPDGSRVQVADANFATSSSARCVVWVADPNTVYWLQGKTTNAVGYLEGPADQALFSNIGGLALAPNGDLYVSDTGNNRIRRIRSALVPQELPAAQVAIQTFAGVTITGIPGRSYQVESSRSPQGPWNTEESLQIPDSPFTWLDRDAVSGAAKFYRVLGLK